MRDSIGIRRLIRLLCLTGIVNALLVAGCGSGDRAIGQLPAPSEEQPLVVVTRNAGTGLYYGRDGEPLGPEHDLVSAFAAEQGWTVKWITHPTTSKVVATLRNGEAHLAAAGLTRTSARDEGFTATVALRRINEQVICRRGQVRATQMEDLAGVDLLVGADTSYAETLSELVTDHPTLRFESTEKLGTERLLQRVAQKGDVCTLADSHLVTSNRRIFPNLDVVLTLEPARELVWYAGVGQKRLAKRASKWLTSRSGKAALATVNERYYSYIPEFDFVDLRALARSIDSELPKYRPLFEKAASDKVLTPDLLAALAYQESHWDPSARSPTGVRGIMMLTRRTAEELGVNRLDPMQAIEGGARYLAQQHSRLPDDIPEPDRIYLALAAYNIGRGHLLDARKLARDLGKNPDNWTEMREVLPLLSEPRYYEKLRYGYARGHEPVHYVQRIRNYRDVIQPAFDK